MQTYKTGYGFCQYGTTVLFLGFWTSVHKLEDHEQALSLVMF